MAERKNNMKRLVKAFRSKSQELGIRAHNFFEDRKGDLATNTIGAIIVAIVIIGILVLAINTFFPDFFADMFQSMQDKLNANW